MMWNQLRKMAQKQLKPWQRTLSEFVGENPKVDDAARNWNEDEFLYSRPEAAKLITDVMHEGPLRNMFVWTEDHQPGSKMLRNQYAVASDKSYRGRYLLMARSVGEDGKPHDDWSEVGELRGQDLGILLSHRGQGAGTAFVKAMMEMGEISPSIGYSPEGLNANRKAHRQIVEEALEKGLPVPDEVLSEYPELKDK